MATEMKQQTKRQSRANSKEAYRLWFEFLKRAIANPNVEVEIKHYKAWGDVSSYRFDKWWSEIGSKVIDLDAQSSVSFALDGKDEDGSYLIRVPKTLTSTDAANQLRQLLIESKHKQALPQSSLRVRQGAEIRPQIFRAFLHTYDRHVEISKVADGKKVGNKELLIAIRKFYFARAKRYKNNLWKVDNLPSNLHTAINYDNLEDVDVLATAQAIATVGRYLKQANEIMENVAKGKFPN